MKTIRIIGILIILCSLLPIGIAGYWYKKTDTFLEKAVKTEAIVVDIDERKSDEGTMYYPVFSFLDKEGNKHKIYSKTGSYPPGYKIGDAVFIFYDPQDPGKTKFDSFVSLWLGPVIIGGLALIPIFLGAFVLLIGSIIIRSVAVGASSQSTATLASSEQAMNPQGETTARTWAMLCHLTSLSVYIGIPFGNIIGPLIVWLIKREEFSIVDKHGKESLNFQISLTIYSIVAFILCFAFIGFLLLPAILIAGFVFVIIAGIKANKAEPFRYPLTIRFIS